MSHILKFIELVRESFEGADIVYTEGSCYRFYLILKHLYPRARALYDPVVGHVYTEIDGKVYDIKGPYINDGRLMRLDDALPIGADPMEWRFKLNENSS